MKESSAKQQEAGHTMLKSYRPQAAFNKKILKNYDFTCDKHIFLL